MVGSQVLGDDSAMGNILYYKSYDRWKSLSLVKKADNETLYIHRMDLTWICLKKLDQKSRRISAKSFDFLFNL